MPYVLFSPIGMTDPVRDLYDGPMLHIVRHYRPHAIWLYLSEKVEQYENEHQWYTSFIDRLAPEAQVRLIRSGIRDVSDYKPFLPAFERELDAMSAAFPEDTVLLNLSSGSQQMGAALCVIASSTPHKVKPIQVKTYRKDANAATTTLAPPQDYDLLWQTLIDNEPDAPSRCVPVDLDNYVRRRLLNNLVTQVQAQAYDAARYTAELNRAYLPQPLVDLLTAASLRKDFLLPEAKAAFARAGHRGMLPLGTGKKGELLEFYLGLRSDLQRKDYTRFFGRLSPFAEELALMVILQHGGIDIRKDYMKRDKKAYWLEKGFPAQHPQLYRHLGGPELRDGYVSLTTLNNMISFPPWNVPGSIRDGFSLLVEWQQELRNMVAHDMKGLSQQVVAEKTGKTDTEIIAVLDRLLLDVTGMEGRVLNSYQRMDRAILKKLNAALDADNK